MSDTPRTDFVAHETGDPEWNRFPNRFARMMAHACILERELAEMERLVSSQGIRLMAAEDSIENAKQWVKKILGTAHLSELDAAIRRK